MSVTSGAVQRILSGDPKFAPTLLLTQLKEMTNSGGTVRYK